MATGEENVSEELKKLMLDLKKAAAKLQTHFDCYDPRRYPVNVLMTNKRTWMKKIDDTMALLTESCLEIKFLDNVPAVCEEECNGILKIANDEFSKFVIELDTKILGDLHLGDNRDARSGSVASGGGQSNDSVREAEAARVAEIDVNIDHEKISDDVKALSAEINKFEDWSKVEPHEIEVAMGRIEGWQKRAKQIRDDVFSMKRSTLKHKLDDTRLRAAESSVTYMQAELENAIEVIQFEDESRCLYSLNKKSSAKVSYPTFSGESEEDFDKFRKEMIEAIKTNQIKRSDQVKVIRNNLSGQPKSMISASLDDVDKAWKILSEIYGGASRLVKAKKLRLTVMGIMPKPDSKLPEHVRQRVEWLLELNLIMKDLSDLAKTNMDCYCETYNDSTIKKIKSFFPFTIHNKMSRFEGSSKEKFEQISSLVETLLKNSRSLLADVDGEEIPDYDDKEASASDEDDLTDDDDDHEDESGTYLNTTSVPSTYFAAVTQYRPSVFEIGEEPPGAESFESLEEFPDEPPLLRVDEVPPEPDRHEGAQLAPNPEHKLSVP